MSATAISERLRDRLERSGETMTLKQRTPGTINDSTLKVTMGAASDTTFNGYRYTHRRLGEDGVTTIVERQVVLARGADLTSPKVGDSVLIGSESRENEVQRVTEHVVSGTVVMYELEI